MDATAQRKAHRAYRVLCLEDDLQDQLLLEAFLAEAGLHCNYFRTRTGQEFEAALHRGNFDLIISDFTIPAYNGMSALEAAKKVQPSTPFLFMTGTVSEDTLKNQPSQGIGYISKNRRNLIVSAVKQALGLMPQGGGKPQASENGAGMNHSQGGVRREMGDF